MRNLFIFLAVILFVLVFAGAASATTAPTLASTPSVSTDHSAIDGHKVVYEKIFTSTTPTTCSTKKDIYVTDLSTGSSKAVSTSSYDERNPDISGNIVVWEKLNSAWLSQIWWKDISKTNPAALVHASPGKDQLNPSISGNYVVWQQYIGESSASRGGSDYNIVGYNLATHTYYPNIASTNLYQGNPDISGNTVVYQQFINLGATGSPNWKSGVYKTTFGTSNKGTKIYASSNDQHNPVVSRTGRAAWHEWYSDTYKYDIVWVDNVWSPTGPNYEYTTNNDYNPAIYANMLVWMEQKSSDSLDYDICMRNLGTKGIALTKTKVIFTGDTQFAPAVGGDKYGIFVSYTDLKDGCRVYWRNMAKPPIATAGLPARNAVNVPQDYPILTAFNEPIKAGTMHIELYEAATKIQVTILSKVINGNILTITHALLKKATKYTITLFEGSITDLIGNKIAIYSRSFTTETT